MATQKPVWLPPEIHQKFREFSVKHKHSSGYLTVDYLLRFHKMVERADKILAEEIKFTLQ